MSDLPLFSIIIPVKNASKQLKCCLESISNLDYPQDRIEVILADGLSRDNTREIGQSWGAKIIPNPKQTVGPGRNLGFFNSRGEYIAFTDADCIVDKRWLKNSLKYFQDETIAGVSGPAITPLTGTNFERAIRTLYSLAHKLGGSAHQERLDKVKLTKDLPGCNAIYRRQALEKVMPVDENLLTAEDVEMNFRIVRLGYKLLFSPDITVYHHRRSHPRMLWRQMHRFAIGRLQVGKKDIRMLRFAHILVGLFIPGGILGEIILYLINPAFLFLNIVLILAIMSLGWLSTKSFVCSLNFLLVFFIAVIAWSLGFMRELLFPLKDITGK